MKLTQVTALVITWGVISWVELTDHWALAGMIIAIVLSVILHELAHFIVAKRGRMKPHALWLGFGPTITTWKVGDCQVGIKALPLGGSCQIPAEQWKTEGRPSWRWTLWRAGCAIAGPAVNLLLCIILVWAALIVHGNPTDGARIQSLTPAPGAQIAQLAAGQTIETIGGFNLTEQQITQQIHQTKPGTRLLLGVKVPGHKPLVTDIVTMGRGPHHTGSLGLKLSAAGPTSRPVLGSAITALNRTSTNVMAQVNGASRLMSPQGVHAYSAMLTGHHVPAADQQLRATSLIGLARLSNQVSHTSWYDALLLLAAINLALALFNALPVPPLDGGHVMLVLYQRIRGKAVPAQVVHWTTIIVLAIFASIALASGMLDIIHPAANPFH